MSSKRCFRVCSVSVAAVSRPLKDRSMPLIVKGSGIRFLPCSASFSTVAPKGLPGLWPSPAFRAKTSRQFPIAMSRVSPNMR